MTPAAYPLSRGLFQGWVLDVVLGRVVVCELVHNVEALTVGVVDLHERLPLVRQRVIRKDRLHRTFRFAGTAIYALLGIDHEDALGFVDAVDRADVHAGLVFDVDAGLGDDVGHGRRPTLLKRSVRQRPEPRAPATRSSRAPGR